MGKAPIRCPRNGGRYTAGFFTSNVALPNGEIYFSRRCGVAAPAWRRIGAALAEAARGTLAPAAGPADCWVAAIADRLMLDELEVRLLSLALHYQLNQRVERLFDALSECRGGVTRFHRDVGLLSLLLGLPTSAIRTKQLIVEILNRQHIAAN